MKTKSLWKSWFDSWHWRFLLFNIFSLGVASTTSIHLVKSLHQQNHIEERKNHVKIPKICRKSMWCDVNSSSNPHLCPTYHLHLSVIRFRRPQPTSLTCSSLGHPTSCQFGDNFFLRLHGLLKIHKRPNDLCETKSTGLVIELQTLPAINPSVDLPRFAFIILIRHKAQTITRNAQPQHRWIVMSHMLTTNVPVDCDDSQCAHKCQHYYLISIYNIYVYIYRYINI